MFKLALFLAGLLLTLPREGRAALARRMVVAWIKAPNAILYVVDIVLVIVASIIVECASFSMLVSWPLRFARFCMIAPTHSSMSIPATMRRAICARGSSRR